MRITKIKSITHEDDKRFMGTIKIKSLKTKSIKTTVNKNKFNKKKVNKKPQ